MNIQLINPNTSVSMTQSMLVAAQQVARSDTIIIPYTPEHGPVSIESHFDEVIAAPQVCEAVLAGSALNVDAHIIACFGDPAIWATRELTQTPVIGIAEAAFHLATMVGERFSIVTSLGRTIPMAEHLLKIYGFESRCAGISACEVCVLDIDKCETVPKAMLDTCQIALDQHGSDVLVLGCGGMSHWAKVIEKELGAPVIEGVTAATVILEGLFQLGITNSKRNSLSYPLPKSFIGRFSHLSNLNF